MTSQGVVYVDETVDEYKKLKLPRNWQAHYEPVWGSLQASMQWCFRRFPVAANYGWLADDTRPRTRGWDRLLEAEAGNWRLAYARDLWYSEDPIERDRLERGLNLSAGLCWGGDLVRTVGWWALPGVVQAGIDTAWCDIVWPLGLHRYVHDVTVEHLNWRTGKRPYDPGDDWVRDGVDYVSGDLRAKDDWQGSVVYRETLARVAKAAIGTNLERVLGALRASYVNEIWAIGALPGARHTKIMEGGYDNVFDPALLGVHTDEGQTAVAA